MFTVYILRTNKNTLYTGQTNNLNKRLKEHREKRGAKYLNAFTSFTLCYTQNFKTRSKALKRELEIKKLTRKHKDLLIQTP